MRTNDFDTVALIEHATLDKNRELRTDKVDMSSAIPATGEFRLSSVLDVAELENGNGRTKFRKTLMSAPRPRRARSGGPQNVDSDLQACWETLPKSIEFLCSFYDDSVTANYYRGEFKESRKELIKRLLDPELSLEESARLLGVCPATVRRYTNRGWLAHHRTNGGQRRFRLSDIVKFVEQHGRFPEV